MTKLTGEPAKKRLYWLDVARVVAIISISCNHAVNRAFAVYYGQQKEFLSIPAAFTAVKTAFCIFSRLGVPVFLMISGALLIKKDIKDTDGVLKFYRHNLLGLFITSEIWMAIAYFSNMAGALMSGAASVTGFIYCFITNQLFINQNVPASFWYIPMILCVYLLIPFMCILRDKVSVKAIRLFMAVLFLLEYAVPSADMLLKVLHLSDLNLPTEHVTVSRYVLFVILGYLISRGKLSKIKNGPLAAGFAAVFIITCAYQYYIFSMAEDRHLAYDDVGVLIS